MMSDDAAQRPWLRFRIVGSDPGGADARDLARLLDDIVSAARVVAGEALGFGRRPGPMSKLERLLAAFRVVSVLPGSVDIALAQPPPPDKATGVMLEDRDLTPGIVVLEFFEEFEALFAHPSLRSVARIGDHAEVVHYPTDGGKLHVGVPLGARPGRSAEGWRRVVYGRVFVDDDSATPERLRVHLTDGSKAVMRPSPPVVREVLAAPGKLAELHVSESTTDPAADEGDRRDPPHRTPHTARRAPAEVRRAVGPGARPTVPPTR